jgi:tetratricopeptide (TPR) repeat protein
MRDILKVAGNSGGSKIKRISITLIALFIAIAAWASPLSVTWIDGKVEKQNGSTWVAINMGDTVDTSDMVRLAKGAMAEFTDGHRKISLSAAGTFSLATLAKAGADQTKSAGTVQKLAKLVDPKASQDQQSQTAVGGVRGDLIGAGVDQTTWVGDDENVAALMSQAQALAHDAKYDEAAAAFGKAVAVADGDQKDQALYSQAWAYSAGGSSLRAVKILRSMAATGTWAGPRAILLGRLDIDSGSAAEAKAILQAAISAGSLAGDDLALAKSMLQEIGQ